MDKPIVIAVVGLAGSGKTEATRRFIEKGFFRVGFNDPLYEEVERRGLQRIEKHERAVREDLREKFGMAVMAERAMPRVEQAVAEGKNVVIESLYSWEEYKLTKQKFGDQFKTVAIFAPPQIRYQRMMERPERPLSLEEAKSRDYAEIEVSRKAGPIAVADWTIQNIGTKEEFFRKVGELVDSILNKV